MTQRWLTRDRAEVPGGDEDRSLPSLLIPMVGSVFQTYGAVWLLCGTPYSGSLGWVAWLRTAAGFLLVTLLAHTAAIWINRRLFRGQVDAPGRLLFMRIWPAVVPLPLLVLLTREQSVWSVLVPGVVAVAAVSAAQRWTGRTGAIREDRTVQTLFLWSKPKLFVRATAPALVCSVLLHGAVLECARGELSRAGWLLALAVGVCVWEYPQWLPRLGQGTAALGWRDLLPRTLLVWLLLLLALLPYVGSKRLALAFGGALGRRPPSPAATKGRDAAERHARDAAYSGVILLFSAKPHREIVPPPPVAQHAGFRERRPLVIPFDGAYWYFRQPDQRPRADAPVVRGDPRRRTIRSTDLRPLSMEAHQRLGMAVDMKCCHAIRLTVQNGEEERGAITFEVLLRDRSSNTWAEISLGSKVLLSNAPPPGTAEEGAVDETLSFPFPASSNRVNLRSFDEITVVIRPRSDRARAGAHIAIESFALLP